MKMRHNLLYATGTILAIVALAATIPTLSLTTSWGEGTWTWNADVWYDQIYNQNPYGQFSTRVTIYELSNDGSTTYDWYQYRTLDNIVPGKQLWGSAYVNDFILAKYYPWQSSQALSDHDPLDDTTDPASVTLTVPPPSFSYTFPIPSIS